MTTVENPIPQGETNTMAIVSLIAGIVAVISLIGSFCLPCTIIIGVIAGAIGAITGFISKKQITESAGGQTGNGLAVGGIITSLIGGVGSILSFILTLAITGLIFGSRLLFPLLENSGF